MCVTLAQAQSSRKARVQPALLNRPSAQRWTAPTAQDMLDGSAERSENVTYHPHQTLFQRHGEQEAALGEQAGLQLGPASQTCSTGGEFAGS